jgi:hypothetical protein
MTMMYTAKLLQQSGAAALALLPPVRTREIWSTAFWLNLACSSFAVSLACIMCDSEHLLTGDEITAEACSSDGDGQQQNDELQVGTCCMPVPTPLGDSLASKEPVSVAAYVSMTTKLEGRDKLTKVSFWYSIRSSVHRNALT